MDHPELYLPFPLCLSRDSFLKEAIGDGDGVADAAVDVLCRVALPPAVDAGLLLALLPADLADEAVDAAEEHHHEDHHARHEDLGDEGQGAGAVGLGGAISTPDLRCMQCPVNSWMLHAPKDSC